MSAKRETQQERLQRDELTETAHREAGLCLAAISTSPLLFAAFCT